MIVNHNKMENGRICEDIKSASKSIVFSLFLKALSYFTPAFSLTHLPHYFFTNFSKILTSNPFTQHQNQPLSHTPVTTNIQKNFRHITKQLLFHFLYYVSMESAMLKLNHRQNFHRKFNSSQMINNDSDLFMGLQASRRIQHSSGTDICRFDWFGGQTSTFKQKESNLGLQKFLFRLTEEPMQSQASLFVISSNQFNDIFDKYRSRTDLDHFPFRLCLQNITPKPKTQAIQKCTKNGLRGPYRRYTCEEKQEIICRMLNGSTLRKISEETLIPKRNLIRWKHEYLHNKSIFRKTTSSTEDCRSDTRVDRQWIETKESISEESLF